MNHADKVKLAGELAEAYRLKGYHCSESSIRGAAEALGIELSDELLRISSIFRGGGGGWGDRCGVVESGLMLLGLLYGRKDPSVPDKAYSYLAQEWHKRFKMEFVSIYCRDILPVAKHRSEPNPNCSNTYVVGTEMMAQMLLDAPDLLLNMPEDWAG